MEINDTINAGSGSGSGAGSAAAAAAAPEGRWHRQPAWYDQVLAEVGRAMQVLDGSIPHARPNPAGARPVDEAGALTPNEARHSAGLMRVNHVGEVCAQALYRGQALGCRDQAVRHVFLQAADEEVDHLAWCRERLDELKSRPSVLNPFWYLGALGLGLAASRAGVGPNLGFMAETERQVEEHLNGHLRALPVADARSRQIVDQMRQDEIGHRTTAENHGATSLPAPVRGAMWLMSRVMTKTAYYL